MATYYINYNTNTGEILTRYISEMHDELIATPPTGTSNLEVSESDFNLTVQTSGYTVVKGTLVPPAPLTDAQLLAQVQKQAQDKAIQDAIKYLKDTDHKMTVDYDKDTTEVKLLRQEARNTIRGVI